MDKQDWKNLLYGFLAICIYFGIEFGMVAWRDAKLERERVDKIKKPRYKAMNVIKYSNDTIEFFFKHDWRGWDEGYTDKFKRIYGENIHWDSRKDKLSLYDTRGDTLRVRFLDSRLQHKFEKEWEKYNGYKLTNTAKIRRRAK